MTAKDQYKIMAKGFTIIRADQFRLIIKSKSKAKPDGWIKLDGPFASVAAMERAMAKLLLNKMTIED